MGSKDSVDPDDFEEQIADDERTQLLFDQSQPTHAKILCAYHGEDVYEESDDEQEQNWKPKDHNPSILDNHLWNKQVVVISLDFEHGRD
jgi:hypothetical protein